MSRQWTKPLEWSNEGAEPSATLKGTGFVGGYKPPAGVFNYAFNKNQTCIEELQAAVDDVDSDISTLNTNKQAKITGAATTITGSNLTANRALVSDSSGKVAVSDVTATELGYLDGVTSNVQTQLDGKAASSHTHSAATTSSSGFMSSTDKAKLNGIESGANKTTVDSELSSTSTNPVQNKVINEALAGKAASDHTHTAASIGAATTSDVTNAVNAVEIGGRNIATSTANIKISTSGLRSNGEWRISGSGACVPIDIENAPINSISKGVRFTITEANKQVGITQNDCLLNKDGIYTLSCWVKCSVDTGAQCILQPFNLPTEEGSGFKKFNVSTSWQYIQFTSTKKATATQNYSIAYIYLTSTVANVTLDVCGIKFEKGNKATDWTPAPEDLASASHTHAQSDITGLENALDGKASASHTHAQSDITGLATALSGKADTDHTHEAATTSADGFLSSTDKTNLDNVASIIKATSNSAAILNNLNSNSVNQATGAYSLAEGYQTTALGESSHAEGQGTVAQSSRDHAEGLNTLASGGNSHAEGQGTIAAGINSHAEGANTTASGGDSHAEGYSTNAAGDYSHAEGYNTFTNGVCSHAGGYSTIAFDFQTVIGKHNIDSSGATGEGDTTGDVFIIGKGTSDTDRSNALRVTTAGKAYGNGAFGSSGADYAEMFEYADKNENSEDRRGLFVTLDGEKIRVANAEDDYILGVVSAAPCIVGDVQSEEWKDRYMRDVFGEKITETVEVDETTDENGVTIPAHTEVRYVINPEYDPEQKYTSRDNRKEWAAVGMIGKLVVVDDGTCQVNGYCKPDKDGKATAAETGYRVMSRIDKTHIRILFK